MEPARCRNSAAAPSSTSSASSASSALAAALNATGGTGLTVSDGGDKVLMNGAAVDFRNDWSAGGGHFGGAVYEHDGGASSDVYIRDDYLRQMGGLAIGDAAEPGYALVGSSATNEGTPEVVFVRKVGGHEHVFLQAIKAQNGAARDLTPNATTDCTDPAISPDGATVAFSTASGVLTVSADGSGTPTQITNTPGFPSFRAVS